MNDRQKQNIFHVILNLNLIVENVTHITSEIRNCVNFIAKSNKTSRIWMKLCLEI